MGPLELPSPRVHVVRLSTAFWLLVLTGTLGYWIGFATGYFACTRAHVEVPPVVQQFWRELKQDPNVREVSL